MQHHQRRSFPLFPLFAFTVTPLVLIHKTIKDHGFYTVKLYLHLTKEDEQQFLVERYLLTILSLCKRVSEYNIQGQRDLRNIL